MIRLTIFRVNYVLNLLFRLFPLFSLISVNYVLNLLFRLLPLLFQIQSADEFRRIFPLPSQAKRYDDVEKYEKSTIFASG